MNTDKKILELIESGLKGSTLSEMTKPQINALYKRLTESKKESKEETQIVTTQLDSKNPQDMAKLNGMLKNPTSLQNKNVQVKETEMTEDDDINISSDPDRSADGMGMFEKKDMTEKFESKAQQKLFWAKCGDGKTKEQKKWCKMAKEFSDSTSKEQFKKMPEKLHTEKTVKVKKETNETFDFSDYFKKVTGGIAKNYEKNLSTAMEPKFESKLESRILEMINKHMLPKMSKKEFVKTIMEAEKEIETPVKPGVKPERPRPATPYQPKHEPPPKAAGEKEIETPVKPGVKPERPRPATPYQPKHEPAPKAKVPEWLSFNKIGFNFK